MFWSKRKTIFNNLKEFFNHEDVTNDLLELNIDKNRRPGTLSSAEYTNLLNCF